MKHKRKRPKNRRAGCLMCKPHKANGQKRRLATRAMRLRWLEEKEQRAEAFARTSER